MGLALGPREWMLGEAEFETVQSPCLAPGRGPAATFTKVSASLGFLYSVMSNCVQPHGLYVAHQALLSMEFSRQECWSGLLFPSPGDLPDPGIKPRSPAL